MKPSLTDSVEQDTKTIEWAYPSSDFARKFGFYNEGCWTILIKQGINPPKGVSGHKSKLDAFIAAQKLDNPWNKVFFYRNPEFSDSGAYEYAATVQGGIGEGVWDRELTIKADSMLEAATKFNTITLDEWGSVAIITEIQQIK